MTDADSCREVSLAKNKGVDLYSRKRFSEAAACSTLSAYVYGRNLHWNLHRERWGRYRDSDVFMLELLTLAASTFSQLVTLDPSL